MQARRPQSSTPSPGARGGTAAGADRPLLEKMDASTDAEVSPPVVEKMDAAARSKPVLGPSSRGAPSPALARSMAAPREDHQAEGMRSVLTLRLPRAL
jgi:hypothetical protein